MRIGILREEKIPIDRRVPITPKQAADILSRFPQTQIHIQPSDIRCYTDHEYLQAGVTLVEDLSSCDVLMGVKEVPAKNLIANKTYLFFSHTIKKQPYNQKLMRELIAKKIRMIDYETLKDESGVRVVAFGRWAGIVGAYNTFWTYGKRYGLYELRRAKDCFDLADLKSELAKIDLPPIKIVLTGGGRVAKGAMEILMAMKLHKVTPTDFLQKTFEHPIYTQLNPADYHIRLDGDAFSRDHFFKNPTAYSSDFLKYAKQADMLIAAAYWDPKSPRLFTFDDMTQADFAIDVIGDITCDIDGSIPSTQKPSTIDEPVYDFNPYDRCIEPPFTDEANVSVMAIDNLPCELPRDASQSFGDQLLAHVIPSLIENQEASILQKATICREGKLNEPFGYLADYAGLA